VQPPVDLDELLSMGTCAEVCAYRQIHPRERVELVSAARSSLTRDVRLVRDAVWSAFRTRCEWPTTRGLDVELSSKGLVVQRVAASDLFIQGNTVSLSLRGLWLTPNSVVEQDRVMRVLSALCEIYVSDESRTSIRSDELHRLRPEIAEKDARWVWMFLRNNKQFHVGAGAEAAAFILVDDLLAFRGAASLEDAIFALSRREVPLANRRRGVSLVPGLPLTPPEDEDNALDEELAALKPTSQIVVVAVPQSETLKIVPVEFPPLRPEPDENIGAQMGQWRVGERIGAGGYGKVYLAEHQIAAIPAVIKAIGLPDEEARERFRREANALGTLQHPSVPIVYDAGLHERDLGYIALERLHGADLQRLSNNGWRPSEDDVVAIVTETLRVLELAHDHGIVHRDIKPSNLFLQIADKHYRLKVLDFGCAKLIGASKLTQTGSAVGTLIYQPPEALSSGQSGIPGDLWSLAVTAQELVTGRHPFQSETLPATVARISAGKGELFDAALFPRLLPFVQRSLHVDPHDRPQSATDALRSLV
jgi:Protein kinase domain